MWILGPIIIYLIMAVCYHHTKAKEAERERDEAIWEADRRHNARR